MILRMIGDLPNTYSFTKSLAEDAIRREAHDLPILVFRPTVGVYLIISVSLNYLWTTELYSIDVKIVKTEMFDNPFRIKWQSNYISAVRYFLERS